MGIDRYWALNISYYTFWRKTKIGNGKGDKLGALVGRKTMFLCSDGNDLGAGANVSHLIMKLSAIL